MALLEISAEQILSLIQQLPPESKQLVFESLRKDIAAKPSGPELDEESKAWLEADLAGELPEYDWGPAGIPEGLPIQYVPGKGMMIIGIDAAGS